MSASNFRASLLAAVSALTIVLGQACSRPGIVLPSERGWSIGDRALLQQRDYAIAGDRIYVHLQEYQKAGWPVGGETMNVEVFAVERGSGQWRGLLLVGDTLGGRRAFTIEEMKPTVTVREQRIDLELTGIIQQWNGAAPRELRVHEVELIEAPGWVQTVCALPHLHDGVARFLECSSDSTGAAAGGRVNAR